MPCNVWTILVNLLAISAAGDHSCSSLSGECAANSATAAALFQTDFVKKDKSGVPPGLMVVPLQAMPERAVDGLLTVSRKHYVGNITVGYPPQVMQVMFDTGSPYTLLAHRACKSKACREHSRYSTWNSQTAVDIDLNGERLSKTQRIVTGKVSRDTAYFDFETADLGSGRANGVLVRDTVCVKERHGGDRLCAKPGIVIAIEMDDVPFRALPSDGIVGLGLQDACGKGAGVCSFFDTLLQNKPDMRAQFGLTFGSNGGELHLGGYHPSALAGPLHWFPAHSPEEGLWQVEVRSVRLGSSVTNACEKGCHAVIDTSADRLGVGASQIEPLAAALGAKASFDGQKCLGAELVFDLGGMTVVLGPEDYLDAACKPDLGPLRLDNTASLDMKGDGPMEVITMGSHVSTMYAFGQLVLRHYFVAFDWKKRAIGFAPSSKLSKEMGKPAAGGPVEQVTV